MMDLDEEYMLRNRDGLLDQLDAAAAEDHLIDFSEQMWSILEPGRRMVRGWALSAICEHLEAVTRKQIKRLLINVPPGCMKSLMSNVFWPAWEWGPRNMPWLRYVGASYNVHLTVRDNVRCRNLIVSPLYQRLWGERVQLMDDQNNKVKFENAMHGWKFATSASGVSTGERGDRVIVDDPHSVVQAESETMREGVLQWFTESLPTRLNDSDSAVVIIMQRVHERDVSGLVLSEQLGYEHLCLPMEFDPDHPWAGLPEKRTIQVPSKMNFEDPRIARYRQSNEVGELVWPERFSATDVAELQKILRSWGGTYAEDGQLQQLPSPRGGGMFKQESFTEVDMAPINGRSFRVWDLAGSKGKRSPFTAGVKGKRVNGTYYVEHVIHERWDAGDLEKKILEVARTDGKRVTILLPQDPNQAGKAQRRAFARLLAGFDVRFYRNTQDKEQTARPWAAQVEGGNVKLVKGKWTKSFIEEHIKFPAGRYKDQVDACAQLCDALASRGGMTGAVGLGPVALGSRLPDPGQGGEGEF